MKAMIHGTRCTSSGSGAACVLIGKPAWLQIAPAIHGWVNDMSLNLGMVLRLLAPCHLSQDDSNSKGAASLRRPISKPARVDTVARGRGG